MSEEVNNINTIPEFKMYITDLETGKDSKEINISDLIFDDYIEFEFGDYEEDDYATLPYKDFKFFINDYSITIYSPQMKELENQLQQKENIIKEVREYIENNWISKKDADYYRCDDAELDIEISDIAVLFDILDKGE